MSAPAPPVDAATDAPRPRAHRRRGDAIALILLLGVALGTWVPRLRGPIDLRWDASVYYILGTSLYEGSGYRLLNEPGQVRAVQYPPGLPAIAAAAQWVSGSSDPAVAGRWLRAFNLACYAAYLLAVYALSRRYFGPAVSVGVSLVAGLHHQTLFLSDLLFAELPFTVCALAVILLNRNGGRPVGFAAQTALGWAAFMLRSAGLALLAAWVGDAVFRRQWRLAAARAATAAIPVLAWQAYVGHVTASDEYVRPAYEYQRAAYQFYNVPYAANMKLVDPFAPELGEVTPGGWVRRLTGNVPEMISGIGQAVLTDQGALNVMIRKALELAGIAPPTALIRGTLVAATWALGLAAVLGTAVLLARREWLLGLFVVAAAVLVATTPWPMQYTRYLTPTIPMLVIAVAYAIAWVTGMACGRRSPAADGATGRAATGAVAVVLSALLLVNLVVAARLYRPVVGGLIGRAADAGEVGRLFYYFPEWQMYDLACDWIAANAVPDAVVVTATPQWAYVRSGRRAVMTPMIKDPVEALRLVDGVPVTYAIDDQMNIGTVVSRYLRPAIAHDPDGWRTAYVAPDGKTRVVQRVRPPAGG